MTSPILIDLEHVECAYYIRKSRLSVKKITVLNDVSLKLYQGETLGIIGSNGAGKSTLLQILAGILMPTKGTIRTSKKLSIALLTLQLGFSQELTGRENAVLGAMYLGFSQREAEARLDKILDFAEIGQWANEPLRTYSTGMRTRLGFAVAMEMSPDIMLIDEILGVGDSYFQKKSSQALRWKMQSGQTSVLVSHNPISMHQLCSRVLWLHNGLVHMEGAPQIVLEAYSAWVAQLQSEPAGAC